MSALLGTRLGIVRGLTSPDMPPHFPRSFRMLTAALCDTREWSRWPVDSSGAGYSLGDPAAARAAALGEAAERYCGSLVPTGLRRSTHVDLAEEAVDPEGLALFSEGQYSRPDFPFVRFDRSLEVEWARGSFCRTEKSIWVPASLVWVAHPLAVLPRTNPVIQAGLAAGPTREFAVRSGLAEVVERDAMTRVWHGGGTFRLIQPPDRVARQIRRPLSVRFLEFANQDGLLVIGALLRDERTGYLTLGMGSRVFAGIEDAEATMLKAVGEALQLQLFVSAYDNPDGGYMRAAAGAGSPLKPWRADRKYSESYRADLADVVDYGCHLQLYLDPVIQERFEAELDSAISDEMSWEELSVNRDRDLDPIVVDMTTPDVAACGMSVVRVIAPGLYSNSAAGLPFHGGPIGSWTRALPLPH